VGDHDRGAGDRLARLVGDLTADRARGLLRVDSRSALVATPPASIFKVDMTETLCMRARRRPAARTEALTRVLEPWAKDL
jgi:hypothetical protein